MYVLARTKAVTTHMTNWNLHLVNVQRVAREHTWDLAEMAHERTSQAHKPSQRTDDLIRIPANSKSRFDLESQTSGREQTHECNLFLHLIGG